MKPLKNLLKIAIPVMGLSLGLAKKGYGQEGNIIYDGKIYDKNITYTEDIPCIIHGKDSFYNRMIVSDRKHVLYLTDETNKTNFLNINKDTFDELEKVTDIEIKLDGKYISLYDQDLYDYNVLYHMYRSKIQDIINQRPY